MRYLSLKLSDARCRGPRTPFSAMTCVKRLRQDFRDFVYSIKGHQYASVLRVPQAKMVIDHLLFHVPSQRRRIIRRQ